MSQHPIDLLPESIRIRCQARLRAGRFITFAILAVLTLVVLTTHSRLLLRRGQLRLEAADAQMHSVEMLESTLVQLRRVRRQQLDFEDQYRMIAMPMRVSGVLATVINRLPESVTLDEIHVEAGRRRSYRSPRGQGPASVDGPPPRLLTAELAGFAASDEEVAGLVDQLSALPLVDAVSLDFSRSRTVRERAAREFRVSFTIDLERHYEPVYVTSRGADETARPGEDLVHAEH